MKFLLLIGTALVINTLFVLGAEALSNVVPAAGESTYPLSTLAQYLVNSALVGWGVVLAWGRRRPRRVLLVGSNEGSVTLRETLENHPRYEVAGVLDPTTSGPYLPGWISAEGVREVVITDPCGAAALPAEALVECRLAGARVVDYHAFYETLHGRLPLTSHLACHLAFAHGFDRSWATGRIRRAVEVLVALLLFIPAVPLILVAAAAIKLDSRGDLFYCQERLGLGGKQYCVWKLRTMVADAEAAGPRQATEDDPRITRVGHVLRRLRIDELPQIWNVITGDMSLIGPRPERQCFAEELEARIPFYRYRTAVKPGITGWAQVNAEYAVSEEEHQEKLEYDLYYLKNQGPWLDLRILAKTVGVVLCGRGR